MGVPKKKNEASAITSLLHSFQAGDNQALDTLMPLVYDQLKKVATNQLRSRPKGTLSSTVLVHEVFVKLKEAGSVTAKDRTHFFAIAAQTMRWFLNDYARAKRREKRGGGEVRLTFDENLMPAEEGSVDLMVLNDALKRLERQDPRLCRVVELRHLVGLSIDEVALILGISPMTVKRDWLLAKTWLARELDLKLP